MHKSRLGNVVIDCRTEDLLREARFWSAALGCPLPDDATADSKYITLQTKAGDVRVILQRVDHDPRAHLDIETDSIEEELNRLEKLGATIVSRQDQWVVMQAPSGHRFCVGKPYRDGFENEANVWK
jgi:predicted enzyme related to lactoylglutathione lyase